VLINLDVPSVSEEKIKLLADSGYYFVVQLLALVFGATPILRNLIFTEHSIFFFLYDSLNILG
jgi:hypothetical protein